MEKGVFVLSLDTELAWGCCGDKSKIQGRRRDFLETRNCIKALLNLLEKHNISATWAIVGHLFLSDCNHKNGVIHPEIIRPQYSWFNGDWFESDPCSNINSDPIWYGKDIVESIQSCQVPQELGCHTFSHIIVDGLQCGKECLDSELKLCQDLARNHNVKLKSFIFPRNEEGYVDVLADNGFIAYRGKGSHWYHRFPGIIGKMANGADSLIFFVSPFVGIPEKKECWDIKASYFYGHGTGLGKLLPISCRLAKVKSGISRAAKELKVFHMWFHPFNLASNPDGLLAGLDNIFCYVARLRNEGKIDNLTMGELAERLEKEGTAHSNNQDNAKGL